VNGIFAPNETSTIAMTKAVRDTGRGGGKIKLVGFDAGSQEAADLRNGDLQGLVVQDPHKMGYLGVMTLVAHLQGKPVEKRIETAVTLVTKENIDEPGMRELLRPALDQDLK
jgi:ribose transport system substrate-binding protein